MAITGRLRGIIVIAIMALVGAVLIGQPARGANSVVTGWVSSGNGPVNSGVVAFFATCQDWENGRYTAYNSISGGGYWVNVPDGSYRVGIRPSIGTGAGTSWHNAKATCEQADIVTVSGYTTLDLVALPGSDVTGTVSSSNGPVTTGTVQFFATCQNVGYVGYAAEAYISEGRYTATVADGTYRVVIQPSVGMRAVRSWHRAIPTTTTGEGCEQADVVTVSGDTTQNLVAAPAFAVTGRVSSGNGPWPKGEVHFVTTCQADETELCGEECPNYSDIWRGTYRVTVPAGTYRVLIRPYDGGDGLGSWHSAKTTCDQADVVTVSGNTTQDLVALPGKQKVKSPPAKLKRSKTAVLAKTSYSGTRVVWKSTTKKVCRVKRLKVTGIKKGKCVLRAVVPQTIVFTAYSKKFTIRVK